MPQLPKILTRQCVAQSRLFKVEGARLRFNNGEERDYEYLCSGRNGAVIIVPMITENEALLVNEYGIGLETYEWGLPKGRVDDGETFEQAANRELKEEAGFGARQLDLITVLSQSPNYMQHRTHVVLARGLYEERLEGDEPEPLGVKRINIRNLSSMMNDATMTEARTWAALYIARDWLDTHS